jgi:hypothetical protein
MLFESGINVNTQGRYYGIALQAASARGHDSIVQRLFEWEPMSTRTVKATGAMRYMEASASGHNTIV